MDAAVGDRIEVTSNTLGVPPRHGEVIDRRGATMRVQWDDGHESVFVPSSNCRVVDAHDDTGDDTNTAATTTANTTHLTCHIEIDVVEDADECSVTATLMTTRGPVQADARARRNPVDPEIPLVGEELAIGRALQALGSRLVAAAGDDLAGTPPHEEHLVGRS